MKGLIVILMTVYVSAFSQDALLYHPDGMKYKGETHTIELINRFFEPEGRVYMFVPFYQQHDVTTTVGFKLFTDTPLWVMTNQPEKINDAINKFNITEFLKSRNFLLELEAFIEKGVLSEEYFLETIGEPTKKSQYHSKETLIHRWTYEEYGVVLFFDKGIAIHFQKN